MDPRLTIQELEQFSHWLRWGQQRGERAPYIKYLCSLSNRADYYYNYNPFELERTVKTAIQAIPPSDKLLIQVSEEDGFAARVSHCTTRLHGGDIYDWMELQLDGEKAQYPIAGYGSAAISECCTNAEQGSFIKGISMATAVVYQRAIGPYQGLAFFAADHWPVAVRIR